MITVASVLALRDLGLGPLVEADTGRSVSRVLTSELAEPAPSLAGGEIVLLTGLHSAVRDASWCDRARRPADRGVVPLGMGAGKHLCCPRVPRALAQPCPEAGLTLFGVPERTPFLGTVRAAADTRGDADRVQECVPRTESGVTRPTRTVLVGMPETAISGGESAAVLVVDEPEELADLRAVVERSGLRAGLGGAAPAEDAGTVHRGPSRRSSTPPRGRRISAWDDVVPGKRFRRSHVPGPYDERAGPVLSPARPTIPRTSRGHRCPRGRREERLYR